ncbi:MAG: hypothetical protein KF868_05900 [Acidobacteria bacterium]|nr:hypothetical protein [Acidobacteriota bacterium]MCW5970500.1 hypothetical protein [Blastocatellales bacterium]
MPTDRRGRHIRTHRIVFSLILLISCCGVSALAQMSDLEATREALGRTTMRMDAIDRAGGGGPARVWQMTGPFGGDVISLAIDPRRSDTIVLGTHDGQLFRSTDGGRIWRRIKPGIGATGLALSVIVFDRARAGVIYVGAQQTSGVTRDSAGGSVFVTEDDGASWREIAALRGRYVLGMVQWVKNPAVLAVAARDGVYRSLDGGATWRKITPENDPELTYFHSVAIDPRSADTIYVGTWHLPWKTIDGGATWKRAGSKETGMIDDSDIFAIHIDEQNPDTVLMSACSGIYRSVNASKTWTKIQGIPSTSRRTHVIFQHPTQSNLLFAGTTEGLWRSTDAGKPESWSRVTPLRLVINAVAVHPDRPDRVYLGTDDYGVLVSEDAGESYEPSNAGFISRQVHTVLADRNERGRVYAGVIFDGANGGLFISEDGGVTWQQSMRGMGVRDVYSIHQSPAGHLYAGTNHGVFRSDDHGRNWTPVKKEEEKPAETAPPTAGQSAPRRVQPVVQRRTRPGTKPAANARKAPARAPQSAKPVKPVKVDDGMVNLESQVFHLAPMIASGGAPGMFAATWDGLFFTEDEKKGWKPLRIADASGAVLSTAHINTLATTPLDPGRLWVGTDDGLFISRDGGASFVSLTLDRERRGVRAVAFDPRNADVIYLGTTNGFFRSVDGGQRWERRGGGMPEAISVNVISISPVSPDEIYVGDLMYGNFYYSRDRGRTWDPLDTTALPSRRLRALDSDPFDRHRVYAGSFSGGVYVMSRQGGSDDQ